MTTILLPQYKSIWLGVVWTANSPILGVNCDHVGTALKLDNSSKNRSSSSSSDLLTQHRIQHKSAKATNIQWKSRESFRFFYGMKAFYKNNWNENVLEDLEIGVLEYTTVEKFLADLKK